jgi:hypothetical protein
MNWLWWLLAAPFIIYFSVKVDEWRALKDYRREEAANRLANAEAEIQKLWTEINRLKSN